MMVTIIILLAVIGTVTSSGKSRATLMCYTCQYTGTPGADPSCLTQPDKVPLPNTANCGHDRVCTVMVQWSVRENVIRSFYRGCGVTDKQYDVSTCETDIYFKTCTTACDNDHCNTQSANSVLKGQQQLLTGGASHAEHSNEDEEITFTDNTKSRSKQRSRPRAGVEARTSAAVTSLLQMTSCLIGVCVAMVTVL